MTDFRFRLRPRKDDLPHCSAVINGISGGGAYHVAGFKTTLSLKSVVQGTARYRTRQGIYLVEEGSFLILNHGQDYALDISGPEPVETLCPFFQPGLVEHVGKCLATPCDRQLDDPYGPAGTTGFYERLYPKSGALAVRLARLRQGLHGPGLEEHWLEEQLYGLAAELVRLAGGVRQEIASFPGCRAATRAELYRRLHRARDYIESCFAEALSVGQLARIACLSPYHFQRVFKEAFRLTPMQYLRAKRLQVARRLVTATDRDITSICLDVGFASLGTFSWLFRKQFGVSPRDLRRRGKGG
jgi:AraC-like DNA-binding protein